MRGQIGSSAVINAPLSGCHLQVIACAGSGKTENLALRVAHLLMQKAAPESIVAFTFTQKAAAELKHRIISRSRERCDPATLGRIGRLYVGTMHAYALRLLQAYVPRYAAHELIEEDALHAWVARHAKLILGTGKWARRWERIGVFLKDVDRVENEAIWPAGHDDFSKHYRAFIETLEAHRLLTFGRCICAAVEALATPDVSRRVHAELKYLFVDEYQDVNPAQEGLVCALAGRHTQLFVVGDDDQSIYQWRGSKVQIIQEFFKRYPPVQTFELGTNRRSLPSIVSVAADFAATIVPRLPKSMSWSRTQAQDAHPVRIITPASRQEEANEIASGILRLMKAGWQAGQIAILVRNWGQAPAILDVLHVRGILYDCSGASGLFQTQLGYLLLAALMIAINDRPPPHGWRQKQLPPPPTTQAQWAGQLAAVLQLQKSQKEAAQDWLAKFAQEARGSGTRSANLVAELHRLGEAVGISTWDLDDSVHHAWFGTYARFCQVVAAFEKAHLSGRWVSTQGKPPEFVGGQDRGAWFYRNLASFLSGYALNHSAGYAAPPDPSSPAVQLTTVHSSKGLQWPVVFMPGMEKGKFPPRGLGEVMTTPAAAHLSQSTLLRYAGSELDERRLFYVGMTRARDLLILSCPQKVTTRRVSPSPFFEHVRRHPEVWVPPEGIGAAPQPDASPPHALLPSFSFSELALYGSCPHAYRLSTQINAAAPLARDLGFGKSIHHILRRAADIVKATGKVPGRQEIAGLFDSEFHVPYATKAGHLRMRQYAETLVERYMGRHGGELRHVWAVERPFELHLDSLMIAGRPDIILNHGPASAPVLTVVDYKTYGFTEPKLEAKAAGDQLRIYTAAARAEGFEVRRAVLHDLKNGAQIEEVAIDTQSVGGSLSRAKSWSAGILKRDYPPRPEERKCGHCGYKRVCRYCVDPRTRGHAALSR